MRVGLVSPYSYTYPGGVGRHVEALAGEDDSEDHEWAVYVRVPRRSEGEDAVVAGRLAALAEQHGGWYDPQP